MLNYLIVFGISMLPLVELRGAIPFAYAFHAADPENFNLLFAYIIIAIGNMLPVPVIFFFARKVLEWGKDKRFTKKFFTFCLEKGHRGGQKLQEKAGKGLFFALMLFVGIPLPGTGAWVGTLAASLLDMKFKQSIIAVLCGVALAGIIVGLCCTLGFGAWFGITQ
ncbi:MAG: small multi-drug export protein [Lachnospiraceae bacterium]|nr:small multi-drug export protein [Lachnospiraceae bacterium]